MTTVEKITPVAFGHFLLTLSNGTHVNVPRGKFVPQVGDAWPPVDPKRKTKPEKETWK